MKVKLISVTRKREVGSALFKNRFPLVTRSDLPEYETPLATQFKLFHVLSDFFTMEFVRAASLVEN